jgi:hypothetical protein
MKKIVGSLAGFLILGSTAIIQAGDTIEEAIIKSNPNTLRALTKGLTLPQTNKEKYTKMAQKISQDLRQKLEKCSKRKDIVRIAQAVGSGIMGLAGLTVTILAVARSCKIIGGGNIGSRQELMACLGVGCFSAIVTPIFSYLTYSQLCKGWTQYECNSQLNQALAVEGELRSIAVA